MYIVSENVQWSLSGVKGVSELEMEKRQKGEPSRGLNLGPLASY